MENEKFLLRVMFLSGCAILLLGALNLLIENIVEQQLADRLAPIKLDVSDLRYDFNELSVKKPARKVVSEAKGDDQ